VYFRFSTKYGLASGSVYVYYQAGLWKSSDETLKNYEILKKDVANFISGYPETKKILVSTTESVQSTVAPYTKVMNDIWRLT